MNNERITSVMTGLGFSPYEARAYSALVREYPLTGYELSGRSGIPRSKIYECIERLIRKKLIMAIDGNPVRYVPFPPDELLRRLSTEFDSSIKTLGTLLKEGVESSPVDYIFNISGYRNIIEKAAVMIRGAEENLDLSLWPQEIESLSGDISDAFERGVIVRLLAFGEGRFDRVDVYHHRPIKEQDFTGRWITVVKDSGEVLTGQCSGESSIAAWTRNRCLVFMSIKYIEHEIIKIREQG